MMKAGNFIGILLFPLLFSVISVFGHSTFPIYLLLQTFIHESGHTLTALVLGAKVRSIKFKSFGLSLVFDTVGLSYGKELAIILSGAAANLICSAPFLFPSINTFAQCGVALSLFNLYPLKGSDGSHAVSVISKSLFSVKTAYKTVKTINYSAALVFWLLSVIMQFRYSTNIFLLLFSVYLLIFSTFADVYEDY